MVEAPSPGCGQLLKVGSVVAAVVEDTVEVEEHIFVEGKSFWSRYILGLISELCHICNLRKFSCWLENLFCF